MPRHLLLIFAIIVFIGCNNQNKKTEVPVITGEWWQICHTQPDIAPYQYKHYENNTCDFTIFQAKDGTWQLIACIRSNTYPGSERFLYRWEGTSLADTMWQEKGFFWTTGIKDSADVMGRKLKDTPYPKEGLLQAPHCVIRNNKYYLFHNNLGAYCLISDDGKQWDYLKNDAGDYKFFDMGRDVMIFDDKDNSGKWIAYYTDGETDPQSMAARTAQSLTGEWSEEIKMVYDGFSNTRNPIYKNEFAESPFVVKRGEQRYYLWAQMHVFYSTDPLKFGDKKVAVMESSRYEERCWAPEIIVDNKGNYYIAAYRTSGIWMAKLQWKK